MSGERTRGRKIEFILEDYDWFKFDGLMVYIEYTRKAAYTYCEGCETEILKYMLKQQRHFIRDEKRNIKDCFII